MRWSYKSTTGTTGLWKHIKNTHLELYKQLCMDHKIKPSGAIVKKLTSDDAPILPVTREPFNKESLLRYIHNFFIADDQVSYEF